jgi:hypothetical protein
MGWGCGNNRYRSSALDEACVGSLHERVCMGIVQMLYDDTEQNQVDFSLLPASRQSPLMALKRPLAISGANRRSSACIVVDSRS